MAEIGISIASKSAEYLVDPILRRARYLFCFDQFIMDAGNAKAELESTLAGVKERAEEATKRTEEITQPVKKWLNDVEHILQEMQRLLEKVEGGRNNYFHVSFRYSLAKEMAEKTKKMKKLSNNKTFEPFSHLIQLPGIQYFTSNDFIYFKSTKTAYEQILKAIEDDKCKKIGLYGIGGSGKTTLAKEVGKKVQELKLLDKVIMAVVSQPLNINNVQDQIADQLGLKIEEQSTGGRAQRLSERLRNEKSLIILDDVWGYLNLEDIGIPSRDNKGCCIMLTTRLRNVCSIMDCQSKIPLDLLNEEEAWALFKLRAKITDESQNELNGVARKIADECKGLPIAIVTVGSTLKGKSFVDWKSALSRLKQSKPMDIEEGLRSPYACLELSYDNLRNPVAKSLFLLCSMFPEDHNISKEDLVRLGKGLIELVETFDTMEEARVEIYVRINVLLDSCLLMPSDDQECVKMHDLVRDVALWIAAKEGQAIVVDRKKIPRKLIENETIEDTKVISLWDLEWNAEICDQLRCPTLKILLLHFTYGGFKESNAYLGGMKALKVLSLIYSSPRWEATTWSIPQSIQSLTNLHTLCVREHKLGDISVVGSLKRLEILDFCGSVLYELPMEIVNMNKLKLLDLSGCVLKKSPYEVIGRLSHLQELYIHAYGPTCPENVTFPRLQRYDIYVSTMSESIAGSSNHGRSNLALRALGVEGFNVSALSSSMKDLLLKADIVQLKSCRWGNDNFFSNKKFLRLNFCPGKFLISNRIKASVSPDVNILQKEELFSNLVTLELLSMYDLEQVFQDSSINCSLQQLRELSIEKCNQLRNISFPRNSNLCSLKTLRLTYCPKLKSALFTPSIAQTLVLLEKLYIRDCKNLKHIIAELDEGGNANSEINRDLSLMAFGNLTTVCVLDCDELESIMPLFFVRSLVRLEYLKVRCSNLKYVFGGGKEDWASWYQGNEKDKSMVIENICPALQDIGLVSLPNLIGLFPPCSPTRMERNIVWLVTTTLNQLGNQALLPLPLRGFLNLREIKMFQSIQRCEGIFELQVKGVIDADGNPIREETPLKLNSDLSAIKLSSFPELKFIWKGPTQILSLRRLEDVVLMACPKLKTIFTPTIVTSLPELKSLYVRNCNNLEGILSADSEGRLTDLYASSQNVCFPKLFEIEIGSCNKLKCLFSYSLACHCPSLEELQIEGCSELEGVVEYDEGGGTVVDGHGERVLFPKLNDLALSDLPRLTKIFPGFKYNSSLHSIEDCPKYTVSSTSTSG